MIYAFQNAEEFKELFGKRENGSRKNLVVLNFLRDKSIHNFIRDNFLSTAASVWFGIADPATLFNYCYRQLAACSRGEHTMTLLGRVFYNDTYEMDDYNGICEDGDHRCIRYVNKDTGKVMKMKAGKMFKHLIQASEFGRHLGDPTVLYLCEEFARRWETHAAAQLPEYHLVVDDDFRAIYDYEYWRDGADCGSCMMDDEQYTYYEECVSAQAASLRDNDDNVLVRCVIFTQVHETGSYRIWRLADRQYSDGCSELLKRLLVDALIREGYIDGYKAVGASCWDKTMYVDNEGNSLKDKDFWIKCHLDFGDTLSFQDSFAYYDMRRRMAYNHDCHGYDFQLDTTDTELEGSWDSYHEEYVAETVTVYVGGREETCNADDLDDFVRVDGEYHHVDDVDECPNCGESFLSDNCYYSELTGDSYCCDCCRIDAERKYKEDNWYYAEIDNQYFENEEDVTVVYVWNRFAARYVERTISTELLEERIEDGIFVEHNGRYYDSPDNLELATV